MKIGTFFMENGIGKMADWGSVIRHPFYVIHLTSSIILSVLLA
jgi:hypothetical protein